MTIRGYSSGFKWSIFRFSKGFSSLFDGARNESTDAFPHLFRGFCDQIVCGIV